LHLTGHRNVIMINVGVNAQKPWELKFP